MNFSTEQNMLTRHDPSSRKETFGRAPVTRKAPRRRHTDSCGLTSSLDQNPNAPSLIHSQRTYQGYSTISIRTYTILYRHSYNSVFVPSDQVIHLLPPIFLTISSAVNPDKNRQTRRIPWSVDIEETRAGNVYSAMLIADTLSFSIWSLVEAVQHCS